MALTLPSLVLDTNAALYHLGNRLGQPLPSGLYFVSIITEMELLSYPGLSSPEAQQIHNFLSHLTIININDSIKNLAIQWRRQYKLKLPDAIIVATTLSLEATLLTNDQQLIKIQDLPTKSIVLSL
jgi:predicted nucleic acid-binding protein